MTEPSKRKASKLDKSMREGMINAIDYLLQRRGCAIPFPMDISDESLLSLVESTIDPTTLAALHHIQSDKLCDRILQSCAITKLSVGDNLLSIRFNDSVWLIASHGIPNRTDHPLIPYTLSSNHQSYNAIHKWATDMLEIKCRCRATSQLVDHVIRGCSTAGQIVRVWPELVKFLPDLHKEALQSRLRASQIPGCLDMIRINRDRNDATATLALMSLIDISKTAKVTV